MLTKFIQILKLIYSGASATFPAATQDWLTSPTAPTPQLPSLPASSSSANSSFSSAQRWTSADQAEFPFPWFLFSSFWVSWDGKKNAFQNMWLSPLFYILSHIQSSLLVYLSPFSIGLFLHSLPVLYFLILPTLSPHFPFSSHTLSSPLPSPPVFPTSQSCLLISRWISQEILVSEQFL